MKDEVGPRCIDGDDPSERKFEDDDGPPRIDEDEPSERKFEDDDGPPRIDEDEPSEREFEDDDGPPRIDEDDPSEREFEDDDGPPCTDGDEPSERAADELENRFEPKLAGTPEEESPRPTEFENLLELLDGSDSDRPISERKSLPGVGLRKPPGELETPVDREMPDEGTPKFRTELPFDGLPFRLIATRPTSLRINESIERPDRSLPRVAVEFRPASTAMDGLPLVYCGRPCFQSACE